MPSNNDDNLGFRVHCCGSSLFRCVCAVAGEIAPPVNYDRAYDIMLLVRCMREGV